MIIKAYHQVGGDDRTPEQRKAFLKQVLDLGEIVPAIQRIQRQEMYNECFTEQSQGGHSVHELLPRDSGADASEALILMVKEKVALLPEDGSTHTMFNCLDLLAGDFERVFLSVKDWYNSPNGFVFDAEELLMAGARYRPRDLLGYYAQAVEGFVDLTYDSVEDARRELKRALANVRKSHEATGETGIYLLRTDCAKEACPGEVIWLGPLPLQLAIEMWREGRQAKF